MPIEFSCPSCHQLVRTPDATAGKKGKCPQCRAVVQIPVLSVSAKQAPRPDPPASPRPASTPQRPMSPPPSSGPIEFYCVECGQLVRTPAAAGGKKGKCPNCRALVDIPKANKAGPQTPAATPPAPSRGDSRRQSDSWDQGSRSSRHQTTGSKPPLIDDDDDLAPLPQLTPLDGELEPLGTDPFAGYATPAAGPLGPSSQTPLKPLASLPPLPPLDVALPPLPSLPSGGGLPSGSPFSVGSRPRQGLSDLGRRGLPWELDPSLDTFIDTVRYVFSSPGDAFETMRRHAGYGSPLGFLILSSVSTSFLAVAFGFVAGLLQSLVFWAFMEGGEKGQAFVIHWDKAFLQFGGATCAAVSAAFVRGTIGGFITAALYHVALLICGAARGGFQTTYRVIAFGSGSVYILLPIPLVGMQLATVVAEPMLRLLFLGIPLAALLFVVVMHFIVLTYGFRNAHATSGPQAFAATLVALFLYVLFIVLCVVLVFMALAAFGAKLNLFPPRP